MTANWATLEKWDYSPETHGTRKIIDNEVTQWTECGIISNYITLYYMFQIHEKF